MCVVDTYRRHTSRCTGYKFIRILDVMIGWYQRADVLTIKKKPECVPFNQKKSSKIFLKKIKINCDEIAAAIRWRIMCDCV